MFIKTFRQIVKLFERTNIFSRKFDKREKLAAACRTDVALCAENFEGRPFQLCAEPPPRFMACPTCCTLRQKKEAPAREPPSVNQGTCPAMIF